MLSTIKFKVYNVFILQDFDTVIEKTKKFLDKQFSKDQLEVLKDHLSFDKMKTNNSVNHSEKVRSEIKDKTKFMRKGKIGSYKEEMTDEYIQKFDVWIKKLLENKEHKFNLI
jgi:hypothetical protein